GDIAAVAVAALTEPGHHGRTYELSGPRALTLDEAVAEISTALGRPVRYEAIAPKDYIDGLVASGWARGEAQAMAMGFSPIAKSLEAPTAPGVREALGRDPRDFGEHVAHAFSRPPWRAA
ncbi:SDR family NAD(P)-dependent oxidoreductase, partial [Nocardiopsis sp. MG754419]|nr:SDR family NAD(P)-dependent oxidoreductase [Nocardiopsis sp. MG754419]